MSDIDVTIVSGHLDIAAEWNDLATRAAPNVFMNPAGLNAIAATGYAKTHTLLAREGGKLVGVWALEEMRIGPFRFLSGPPHRYAFVASPVIDRSCTDAVVAAFFSAITNDPSLPKVIDVRFLDGGADSWHALASVKGARRRLTLSDRPRAYLTRETGAKRSGSTRKKMRQDWNRLAAKGAVAIVNDRDPDVAQHAFETFLAMEVKSWKGANDTALLSRAGDAAFVRRWFAGLAAAGAASVALLTLDGAAIAAQVMLTEGTTAYTWKIAFDAAFDKFSPGVLLVDKLSEQLLENGIEQIESCSPQGGFMEHLWSGRRRTVDLLIEVGNRPTIAFVAVALSVRGRATLRDVYHRLRTWRSSRHAPKVAAAT
jgi:CelD/BcsL family acetyltransferase involved in cellulose biosynthesis